jgi:hypothetical protein
MKRLLQIVWIALLAAASPPTALADPFVVRLQIMRVNEPFDGVTSMSQNGYMVREGGFGAADRSLTWYSNGIFRIGRNALEARPEGWIWRTPVRHGIHGSVSTAPAINYVPGGFESGETERIAKEVEVQYRALLGQLAEMEVRMQEQNERPREQPERFGTPRADYHQMAIELLDANALPTMDISSPKSTFTFAGPVTVRSLPMNVAWNADRLSTAVQQLCSQTIILNDGQQFSFEVVSNVDAQYFARREDGLFELRRLDQPSGLHASGQLRLPTPGIVEIEDFAVRLNLVGERQPIPGVALDVGRPTVDLNALKSTVRFPLNRELGLLVRPATGEGYLLMRLKVVPSGSESTFGTVFTPATNSVPRSGGSFGNTPMAEAATSRTRQ